MPFRLNDQNSLAVATDRAYTVVKRAEGEGVFSDAGRINGKRGMVCSFMVGPHTPMLAEVVMNQAMKLSFLLSLIWYHMNDQNVLQCRSTYNFATK